MIEHGGFNNLVRSQIEGFAINSDDNVIQFASHVFDASVSEIFTTLIAGAQLVIVSNALRQDTYQLAEYIEDQEISIATIPPAHLNAMPYKKYSKLKTLIVPGKQRQWSC